MYLKNINIHSSKLLKIILLLLLELFSLSLFAKVEPPNYNFTLDTFKKFMPGVERAAVEKIAGKGLLFFKNENYSTYRYTIIHVRYQFPIFVQFKNDKVIDFHASLPRYFLHNIFHHSLIKRIGKQNKFYNENEHSVYIWNNVKELRYVYSGACSITCFPLYYAVMPAKRLVNSDYRPILEILKEMAF